jgi:tRNA-splicing ligase RtcB (3'-phosphate/5'-hydroxy nucleic acid ligase)
MRLKIFGLHDDDTIRQIETCLAAGGEQAVLCADGHKGYAQPIGGVVAYKDLISLSGVGFDIACGNLACRTDANAEEVKRRIEPIMEQIVKKISFGVGRKNKTPIDHELFDDEAWKIPSIRDLKETAYEQLGTVGSGNHYVDIFIDELEQVWVGVHFGSRGLGHKIASYYLHKAGGKDGMDVPPSIVEVNSNLGADYLEGMRLAGRYAYAGREYVARLVAQEILGAHIVEEIHNHHNFAWQETHNNQSYWVVRKGATPAFPGQKGFVGGSMGDNSVIIEGVESETSKEALYSTIHGAGRVMSRTQAAGKRSWKKGYQGREIVNQGGLISNEAMMNWVKQKRVYLKGGGVDEAPQAYRRLEDVLKIHDQTIRVLHVLKPIGVAMAGSHELDPYKD